MIANQSETMAAGITERRTRSLQELVSEGGMLVEREEPEWLRVLRRDALASMKSMGIPTRKMEDWRFESVRALARLPFAFGEKVSAGSDRHHADGSIAGAASAFGRVHADRTPEQWSSLVAAELGEVRGTRIIVFEGKVVSLEGVEAGKVAVGQLAPTRVPAASNHGASNHAAATNGASSKQGVSLSPADGLLDAGPRALTQTGAYPAIVEGNLGRVVPDGFFSAFNTASFSQGVWLEIPKGTKFQEPLELVHVLSSARDPQVLHRRTLFVVGEGAHVSCLERSMWMPHGQDAAAPSDQGNRREDGGRARRGSGAAARGTTGVSNQQDRDQEDEVRAPLFINEVCEYIVRPGAHCTLVRAIESKASDYVVAHMGAELGENASMELGTLALGGCLQRHQIRACMVGRRARLSLQGLSVAGPEEQVAQHVQVHHRAAETHSEQRFHAVAGCDGTVVFDGLARVYPDAVHVEAHQQSKGMLLHERGVIHAKPHLEIETDEVSCSHGATIGSLDEHALMYLRTRGIGALQAKALLLQGFMHAISRSWHKETQRAQLEQWISAYGEALVA